jgi:prepilin-type N-terminal cleavage/methylation domain-containing protein
MAIIQRNSFRLCYYYTMRIKIENSHGFTIVELLVVVVVIGILASVTIVSYGGVSQRAKIVSLQSDLTQAAKSLRLFQITNSTEDFPTTIDCTIADSATNKCVRLSAGSSYVYTPNNAASPRRYTLNVNNGTSIYRITDTTQPSGSWLAGKAATVMSGKYILATDISSQYKINTTIVASPQGVAGLDTTNLAYIALVNPQTNPSVDFSQYPAQSACITLGGRLPYVFELAAIYTDRVFYGNNFNTLYMSASEVVSPTTQVYTYLMNGAGTMPGMKTNVWPVRCVAD